MKLSMSPLLRLIMMLIAGIYTRVEGPWQYFSDWLGMLLLQLSRDRLDEVSEPHGPPTPQMEQAGLAAGVALTGAKVVLDRHHKVPLNPYRCVSWLTMIPVTQGMVSGFLNALTRRSGEGKNLVQAVGWLVSFVGTFIVDTGR